MKEEKEYIFKIFDISNGQKSSIFESEPMTDIFWTFTKDGITVQGTFNEEKVQYFMMPYQFYLYEMTEI